MFKMGSVAIRTRKKTEKEIVEVKISICLFLVYDFRNLHCRLRKSGTENSIFIDQRIFDILNLHCGLWKGEIQT